MGYPLFFFFAVHQRNKAFDIICMDPQAENE